MGSIIFGIDKNYPPHEYVENGKVKGFNVDIIKAIAEEMGSEIEFKPMTWCEAKEALKNGSIDILCMEYLLQSFGTSLNLVLISPSRKEVAVEVAYGQRGHIGMVKIDRDELRAETQSH